MALAGPRIVQMAQVLSSGVEGGRRPALVMSREKRIAVLEGLAIITSCHRILRLRILIKYLSQH